MAESWSVDEVQTFLSLVAEERIQRELDGATRNEKVFQEVAQLLAAHGYHRTYKQCRDKLKKLKLPSHKGSQRPEWCKQKNVEVVRPNGRYLRKSTCEQWERGCPGLGHLVVGQHNRGWYVKLCTIY